MSDSQPPEYSSEALSKLSSADTQQFELGLLKDEYFFLQTTLEDYNKQIWVIKALGITGTGAVIVLALQQSNSLFALIGCAIPMFFWVLESQWKHFQRGFYPRIAELEAILLTEHRFKAPAIYSSWSRSFKRTTNSRKQGYFWDGLLNPSVFISYVLEIGFLLFVYALDLL